LETLSLQILDVGIRIHCANSRIRELLDANFGALRAQFDLSIGQLEYTVESEGNDQFHIGRSDVSFIRHADVYDLIYFLEKDITVEIQKIRKDLLFIHAAALEYGGQACLIVAPSGSGKSTTTWALLHHGFRYLSDELSPIDLSTMQVSAYPHALCLKSAPPDPYALPEKVIKTIATIHIPVDHLPAEICANTPRLAAIFFLKYNPDLEEPAIHEISAAEASARIYANALNPLAHPEAGIDAGISVAKNCSSFNVTSADLRKTANLIRSVMQGYRESVRNDKSYNT